MGIFDSHIFRVGARMVYNLASDIVNVWWLECLDDGGLGMASLIGDILEVIETIYDELDTLMADNVSFTDITVADFTAGLTYGAWPWPTLTDGSAATSAINPGMGLFCWAPTEAPRCMGKKWFAPFTEAMNADGIWNSTLVIAGGAAYAQTLIPHTGGAGTIWAFRIPHFYEDTVELDPPEFLPYTVVNIAELAGFQTRRRPGTGS